MISNLSIRAKLVLLLLAPLLTLLVFAGIAVADRFETASVATDATDELEVAESAMFVIRELGAERSAAVQLLITSGDGREDTDTARARTDVAVAELAAHLDDGNSDLDSRAGALDALQRLVANRQQIDTFAIEQAEAYENYNGIVTDLLGLETEVLSELGDTELLRQGQLTLAGIQGQERVFRQAAFLGTRLELIELTGPDYVAFSGIQNQEELFFSQLQGSDEISQLWQESRGSMETAVADALVDAVNDAGQGGSIPNVPADVWWEQMAGKAEAFDDAAIGSFDTLLANADSKASSARTSAIVFGLVGLAIIALAVLMALALGRSIARRLQSLSEEASTIATERLPEVLESLRNPTPEALSGAMPTINSDATDEIGVMADSFDTVLRTSVETSIEHSQQRAKTITDLLVNLGRRNQTLIGRQLTLIDDLEAREEDPELLEALFSLDSLITRNRRNSENLLVLAGETASRTSTAPVSLHELVQAAMGEVSELERIEITGDTSSAEMLLGKPAVNLSHLVAELLDNALSFSAKTTTVTAHIDSKPGQHRIWVIDEGVGMTDEELAEANARLLDPADIDELSTDRIGFQVVGRIAQRLGVTVSLSRNPYGGLAARIDVPQDLLLSGMTPLAAPSDTTQEPSVAGSDSSGDIDAAQAQEAIDSAVAPSEGANDGPATPAPLAEPATRPAAARPMATPEAPRILPAQQPAPARTPVAEPANGPAPSPAPAPVAEPAAPVGAAATPVGASAAPVAEPANGPAPSPAPAPVAEPAMPVGASAAQRTQPAQQRTPVRGPVSRSAIAGARSLEPNMAAGPIAAGPRPASQQTPTPTPTAAPVGELKRRTPGESLANDLRAEAEGRVTHRRLGDGKGKATSANQAADRRRQINSRLARSMKDQNQ